VIVLFLHLGGDTVILTKELIAIINLENPVIAASTKEFIKVADEEGFIKNLSEDDPKSCVVTNRDVYMSPISSVTLKNRANFVKKISIQQPMQTPSPKPTKTAARQVRKNLTPGRE
jgi:hypothetical protein